MKHLWQHWGVAPWERGLLPLLYLDGELAVVPGVHYPYANYSHFRSESIYYTGDPIGTGGLGWMGKYMDYCGFGSTEVPAVMLGNDYSPLFTPTNTSLFAFSSLRELRFPAGSLTSQRSAAFRAMYAHSGLSSAAAFPELVNVGYTGVAAVDTFAKYYAPGCSAAGTGRREAGGQHHRNCLEKAKACRVGHLRQRVPHDRFGYERQHQPAQDGQRHGEPEQVSDRNSRKNARGEPEHHDLRDDAQ